MLFLEVPHRDSGGEAVGAGHGLDHAGVPRAHCAGAGPGLEGALGEGEGLVGKDEVWVDLHPGSESRALGTSAVRAVEGEGAGFDLSEADATVDAGEVLRVEGLHAIDDADQDDAVSELQGCLHGVGEAGGLALALADHQAVYDDLDGVFLLLVEAELLGEVSDLAVDPHADESGLTGVFEDGLVLALSAGDHGDMIMIRVEGGMA